MKRGVFTLIFFALFLTLAARESTPGCDGNKHFDGSKATVKHEAVNNLSAVWLYRMNSDHQGAFKIHREKPFDQNNQQTSVVLQPNHPNPADGMTAIQFSLGSRINGSDVTLALYDFTGNKISELFHRKALAGDYEVIFNAGRLTPGVYFYCLKAGTEERAHKLIVK